MTAGAKQTCRRDEKGLDIASVWLVTGGALAADYRLMARPNASCCGLDLMALCTDRCLGGFEETGGIGAVRDMAGGTVLGHERLMFSDVL